MTVVFLLKKKTKKQKKTLLFPLTIICSTSEIRESEESQFFSPVQTDGATRKGSWTLADKTGMDRSGTGYKQNQALTDRT